MSRLLTPASAALTSGSSFSSAGFPAFNNFSSMMGGYSPFSYPSFGYSAGFPAMSYGAYGQGTSGTGGSSSLLMLLLLQLLSRQSAQPVQQNNYNASSRYNSAPIKTNADDTNTNNTNKLTNDDIGRIIINNFILNPKNVNIAGVNNGLQKNTTVNGSGTYTINEHGQLCYCPPGSDKPGIPVKPGKPDVTIKPTPTTPDKPHMPNKVEGDPHVVYQDDKGKTHKYDFMGKPNQWFNAIQDGNLTLNAYFTPWDGKDNQTVMSKIGMSLNDHQLTAAVGAKPTLDGEEIKAGQTYSFDSGITDQNGQMIQASVYLDDKGSINVNTGEYNMQIANAGKYFNIASGVSEAGSYANGKTPDGFMGPIFDPNFVNFGKGGKMGQGAQGEGFLDKKVDEYQVTGQFDKPQYAGTKDVQAQWGVLAGKGTAAAA